ncbi:MAG: hypothetical protein AABX19_01925 [Nanoarchaeota archaeon]
MVSEKPVISSSHAINWYIGNYIMNPNNALRDNEELLDEAHKCLENLKIELKSQKMTHKQFLELIKERGIYDKYYHYEKNEHKCEICKKLGISQRY